MANILPETVLYKHLKSKEEGLSETDKIINAMEEYNLLKNNKKKYQQIKNKKPRKLKKKDKPKKRKKKRELKKKIRKRMPAFKIYNFKAPIQLQNALDRIVYEEKWDSASEFMRDRIMNDPKIQKFLEDDKVQNPPDESKLQNIEDSKTEK